MHVSPRLLYLNTHVLLRLRELQVLIKNVQMCGFEILCKAGMLLFSDMYMHTGCMYMYMYNTPTST